MPQYQIESFDASDDQIMSELKEEYKNELLNSDVPGRRFKAAKIRGLMTFYEMIRTRRYVYKKTGWYDYNEEILDSIFKMIMNDSKDLIAYTFLIDDQKSKTGGTNAGAGSSSKGAVSSIEKGDNLVSSIASPFNNFDLVFDFVIDASTIGKSGSQNASTKITNTNYHLKLSSPLNNERKIIFVKNQKRKFDNLLESVQRQYYKVINLDEWFYNPMNHDTQPNIQVLDKVGKEELLKKYNIKDSQLPKMDCSIREGEKKDGDRDIKGDVLGRYLGLSTGDVVEIKRKTQMNGIQVCYRIVK